MAGLVQATVKNSALIATDRRYGDYRAEEVVPVVVKKRRDYVILPRDPKAAHAVLREFAASREEQPDDEPVGEDEPK